VVDPERQATVQLQQVASLQDELLPPKHSSPNLKKSHPAKSAPSTGTSVHELCNPKMNLENQQSHGEIVPYKAADFSACPEREFADKQPAPWYHF
jgi:capsular polysaccharide transport system permease protein